MLLVIWGSATTKMFVTLSTAYKVLFFLGGIHIRCNTTFKLALKTNPRRY